MLEKLVFSPLTKILQHGCLKSGADFGPITALYYSKASNGSQMHFLAQLEYRTLICTPESKCSPESIQLTSKCHLMLFSPFGAGASGRTFLHSRDNLALVPWVINTAKSIHLPVTLRKISLYIQACIKGEPNDNQIPQDQLIEDCHRIATIRLKVGWKQKERTNRNISTEQLDISVRNGNPENFTMALHRYNLSTLAVERCTSTHGHPQISTVLTA
jgi:hypothetical protein